MISFNLKFIQEDPCLEESVEGFISEWNNTEDYIIAFTSGSTGKPKEIRILKSKMVESARMTGDYLNLKKGDNALLCLSINTIGGKMMVVRSIVLELNLFVTAVDSNPLQKLDEHIDFVAMVPMQLHNSLLNNAFSLSDIRSIIIGGGSISSALSHLLVENNLSVYHTYGMTETISHVAMRRVGIEEDECFSSLGEPLFSESNGQLVIKTRLLEHESIVTNDCIELIDNKHFKLLGRSDFVINSGGVKIHPEEVESKISKLIHAPFFITGLEDAYLGEKVILCIESSEVIKLNKSDFLLSLSKYECPKEIYFIPTFEVTESGKINRLKTVSKLNNKTLRIVL